MWSQHPLGRRPSALPLLGHLGKAGHLCTQVVTLINLQRPSGPFTQWSPVGLFWCQALCPGPEASHTHVPMSCLPGWGNRDRQARLGHLWGYRMSLQTPKRAQQVYKPTRGAFPGLETSRPSWMYSCPAAGVWWKFHFMLSVRLLNQNEKQTKASLIHSLSQILQEGSSSLGMLLSQAGEVRASRNQSSPWRGGCGRIRAWLSSSASGTLWVPLVIMGGRTFSPDAPASGQTGHFLWKKLASLPPLALSVSPDWAHPQAHPQWSSGVPAPAVPISMRSFVEEGAVALGFLGPHSSWQLSPIPW